MIPNNVTVQFTTDNVKSPNVGPSRWWGYIREQNRQKSLSS